MDPRRGARVVIDPKVRQVGFFAPGASPGRTQSGPSESSSPPVADNSPTGNSLSPVMIPPPRHASDNLLSARPALNRPLRRPGDAIPVGSYNPSEFFHGTSPTASFYSKVGDGEFSEDASGAGWTHRGNSGKVASSFPGGGFDLTAVKPSNLTTVSVVNMPPGISVKSGGASIEVQNEQPASSRSLKEKTSKAERRALQEAQRAAKAAAKGDPDAISKVPGREEINYLDDWAKSENLQLLNLIYDATPSDYVSMIITDYGMVPPTSVPVIVREYWREHLWI